MGAIMDQRAPGTGRHLRSIFGAGQDRASAAYVCGREDAGAQRPEPVFKKQNCASGMVLRAADQEQIGIFLDRIGGGQKISQVVRFPGLIASSSKICQHGLNRKDCSLPTQQTRRGNHCFGRGPRMAGRTSTRRRRRDRLLNHCDSRKCMPCVGSDLSVENR